MFDCSERIKAKIPELLAIAQGGTILGTGLNTYEGFAEDIARELAQETGFAFRSAPNKFAALACHDPLVELSGS